MFRIEGPIWEIVFCPMLVLQKEFLTSKHSSWWRRLEDVLKTLSSSSSEDEFKTSWSKRMYSPNSYAFRRRLQDVLIKTNIIVLVIRLQDVFKTFSRRLQDVFKTSCQDIFKTSSRRLQDVLQKRLQDIFKTSSRRFQDVFETSSRLIQDVLKTSSRRLQDVLQRCLQDVFKTFYQVKLILLTSFQNDSETYSKRFWDVLQRRLRKAYRFVFRTWSNITMELFFQKYLTVFLSC